MTNENDGMKGRLTAAALGDVSPLLLPWTEGPFGAQRPPVNGQAMQLSIELVDATYRMDAEAWLRAGWRDVSVQMERKLETGIEGSLEDKSRMGRLTSTIKRMLMQHEVRRRDPVSTVTGTLRQLGGESDTGKVLVMAHPAPGGRHVIAVSFMGTSSHLYDWITNLRMQCEDGLHQGFLQLVRQFEGNEGDITFPETARDLGVESLSLTDVVRECAGPDSRFTLWLTGHSQGGALMQIWAHRLMTLRDVRMEHMLGYGFASPKVAVAGFVHDPAAYPLYLVENSDDVVPRSGCMLHLGVRLVCEADDALRRACYAYPQDEASVRAREATAPFLNEMKDMPSILEQMDGLLRAIMDKQLALPQEMLGWLGWTKNSVLKLASAADQRMDAMILRAIEHGEAAYVSITGREMPMDRVKRAKQEAEGILEEIGVRAFVTTLAQMSGAPHCATYREGAAYGAYPYIILFCQKRLKRIKWTGGIEPMEQRAEDTLVARRSRRAETIRKHRRHIKCGTGRRMG